MPTGGVMSTRPRPKRSREVGFLMCVVDMTVLHLVVGLDLRNLRIVHCESCCVSRAVCEQCRRLVDHTSNGRIIQADFMGGYPC